LAAGKEWPCPGSEKLASVRITIVDGLTILQVVGGAAIISAASLLRKWDLRAKRSKAFFLIF
jgi:hypothetical protein